MDLEARKYHIIQELFNVEEESVIYTLEQVLKGEKEKYINVSEELKRVLDRGQKEIDEGKTFSTEEVMNRVRSKYDLV